MTGPTDDGDRDDRPGGEDRSDRDGPLDIEARFADIVARFDDDAGDDGRPERPRAAPPAAARPDSDATGLTGPRRDGPGAAAEPATAGEGSDVAGTDDRPSGERDRPDERPDELSEWSTRGAGPALAGPPPVEPLVESAAERRARIEREVDRAVDGPDGGHYVPPEPEPLPRQDLPTRLALVAVLLGPVLLIVAAMVWRTIPEWAVGTIVVGIIAGFVVLVSRLPRSRDLDDPDDGARV